VFGELSRKNQAHCSLDFPGGKGVSSRVSGKSASFRSNALKDVVDEGVHDAHCCFGDSSLRVNLSQDLVDVGRIGLGSLALSDLLGFVSSFLGSLCRRLGSLGSW